MKADDLIVNIELPLEFKLSQRLTKSALGVGVAILVDEIRVRVN